MSKFSLPVVAGKPLGRIIKPFYVMLMTTRDLKQKLDELEVDPTFYSLEGKTLNDRMVLHQSLRGWSVFYCDETGLIMNEKFFHTETDACEYLHNYFRIR